MILDQWWREINYNPHLRCVLRLFILKFEGYIEEHEMVLDGKTSIVCDCDTLI